MLAIYDYEVDYGNQLMDYIKRKHKSITQVRVFTNHDSLKNYLVRNQIVCLLLSESIPVEEVIHHNIKHICLLSEGNYIGEDKGYPIIYKFQSCDLIINELLSYVPIKADSSVSHGKVLGNGKVISVFSITNHALQEAVSIPLAYLYAKTKKTLFINLDIYQISPHLITTNSEKDLSEFIYFLKQNHPDIKDKLRKVIIKAEKFAYIKGVKFGPDLYELTVNDMKKWLEVLKDFIEYEIIIFHVGGLFQASLELFRGSNQLLLLNEDSQIGTLRHLDFINQLLWAGYDDVNEKTTTITLSKKEIEKHEFVIENGLFDGEGIGLIKEYVIN